MVRALVVKLIFLLALISEPMQPVWPVAGFPLLSVCLDSASSLHFRHYSLFRLFIYLTWGLFSQCVLFSVEVCSVCTVFYLRIDSL